MSPSTPAVYTDLKNGAYQAPSIYLAALKNRLNHVNTDTLRERMQKVLQREDVAEIVAVEAGDEDDFRIVLRAADEDNEDDDDDEATYFMFVVKIFDNEQPEEWAYEAAEYRNRNLLEDERIEMQQAPQLLECWTYFDENWAQVQWLVQLAVIDAIAGECYALQDPVSSLFFSGTWLAEMAETLTPPSLECAYVIHAIVPNDADAADYWLHTHGLLKFKLPELEILRVPRAYAQACQHLITTTATRLLAEPESWHSGEAMTVAHGAAGDIAVRFMAWQDALASPILAPVKKALFGLGKGQIEAFNGDWQDRPEGDIHTEPSMVLFADVDDKMANLNDLGAQLDEDNHLMALLPNAETARMYHLAAEKLPSFIRCFHRFAPRDGEWGYMMKIACTSPSTDATEHMWFMVQDINEQEVRAELVNDPFDIPEMQNGQVYTLPLERVTDWQIFSAPLQARIKPDDVFRLKRHLRAN